MGWSLSPLLVRSVAWSVLLSLAKDQKPILDEVAFRARSNHDTGQLPTWGNVVSESGTVVDRATVYYDNFLFLIDNPCDLARFESQMAQNCGRLGGLDSDFTGEDRESTGTFFQGGLRGEHLKRTLYRPGFRLPGGRFPSRTAVSWARRPARQGISSADLPRKLGRSPLGDDQLSAARNQV